MKSSFRGYILNDLMKISLNISEAAKFLLVNVIETHIQYLSHMIISKGIVNVLSFSAEFHKIRETQSFKLM